MGSCKSILIGLRKRAATPVSALAMVAVVTMLFAGCGGGDPGDVNIGLGPLPGDTTATSSAEGSAYEASMAQLRAALSGGNGQGLAQAISSGNKQQLVEAQLAWETATKIAASAKPPAAIKALNADMVKQMHRLDTWNKRITRAAPSKARVKRVAAKAQKSAAAKKFGSDVSAIEQQGYDVLTDPSSDPNVPLTG